MSRINAVVWDEDQISESINQQQLTGVGLDDFVRAIAREASSNGKLNKQDLSPLVRQWSTTQIPINPHLSKFYINGHKQKFGIDYNVNGVLVNWLGMTLKPSFDIEFYYYS